MSTTTAGQQAQDGRLKRYRWEEISLYALVSVLGTITGGDV